ncbi:S66 family peptidase [Vibrio nigripulchritudo]|uniref:S66 family peptidase n=1 Tax=Vibrio nigripulchritudo TaxID=28173 RepID=UPI002490F169|nr:S66 peptidase family protein [Vibrio nigripulchritudo]BDU39825.1 LD-carboxypeptidase [Vibrio nigripulchritudo]BDU45549.1 LD-carboxypeptidase [Vibrio nigripulchritudo]
MKYPLPLVAGSTIAITAPSSGIQPEHEARLQYVKCYLENLGFQVVEGKCLRGNHKSASAPADERADELMAFLLDDNIDAIAPPWGGELAMELLPLLDFEKLKDVKPKWVMGFSDISTLTAVLTNQLGWATAHSPNLMDLTDNATERLTAQTFQHFNTERGGDFEQVSSLAHTRSWPPISENPQAVLNPDTPTQWKWLTEPTHSNTMEGRLIGGCWDTLIHLFSTKYLDLQSMKSQSDKGVLLYLENAEMSPMDLTRAILSMKFKGVFECIDGLLLGRNAVVDSDADSALTYEEVLKRHLSQLGIPVMYDLDIGHVPPNLTLINGTVASVSLEDGVGKIIQKLV